MTTITNRKIQFCQGLLHDLSSTIGFVDVGSGGPLKRPWNLLPAEKISKFDFDPEEINSQSGLPICVSNQPGERTFYIAQNPRASSLHQASPTFVERFGANHLLAKEHIQVLCTTLDEYFARRYSSIDLIDVNAEGHDFQVLEGATQLLTDGIVKCIKAEFELAQVWEGQGWFRDIDAFLCNHQFQLADIDIEHGRPANVKNLYHRGEPLWGKAIYVPSLEKWSQVGQVEVPAAFREHLVKALVLYTILEIPGRAVDLLDWAGHHAYLEPVSTEAIAARIAWVFRSTKTVEVASKAARFLKRLLRTIRS